MTEPLDIQTQLERYARAVRELRAVAFEARNRIERAEAVLAEAQAFARDRRRHAVRAAGRHRSARTEAADA
ncbi:MAG: hypothetical protein A3F70_07640 [Acidobacteria bacterium RIFCSPLOWO2_12_FULL_67_14]|nr:MAG: hypothetical protein A3H29_04040 [Acidobacteria bacterium RIFCSPLOWO2_02_FULL_67_21]OFW40406.1 MAG: hypothetical protein A3F70_07640 [Acidobacteria bacterium RIFCSPLOWO2_12_FULL_67_14]